MEWKLFETFQSPVGRGAPLRPSNRRLDFFGGEPSHLEVAICVFGQPNCFHLLKGRLLIGFHSPPVTRNPLLLLCDRAQPENSPISSNFRAIWFAGRPTCKALRACLRQPLTCIAPDAAPVGPTFGCSSFSHPRLSVLSAPSALVQHSASPEWRRSGKYFDFAPFRPALHPLGQPSVARPTGFPALRFPTRQFRMKTRADLQQRSIAGQCRKEWRVTGGGIKRHFLTRNALRFTRNNHHKLARPHSAR